ncbi:MAG: Fic family protein [Balneolaceae bacterium]|nr:Fic family protein [Balneolaceae bacterium]
MSTCFSQKVPIFHGRHLPEEGWIVGYAAIIDTMDLKVPVPDVITMVSERHKAYTTKNWRVLTPRYKPDETLYDQLVFALKYEGVNLLCFKKIFDQLNEREIVDLLSLQPTGQYTRKIWFLCEWLRDSMLPIPDLRMKNYVPLLDPELQYALHEGTRSSRHRIINNLPGTVDFCPLIRKTVKLETYISKDLSEQKDRYLKGIRNDIMQRASAFLLLKDSKASFAIEGESPRSKRAARWGDAIGQAGQRDLSHDELKRLQQIVIEDTRFVKMGYRQHGGFVGEHDRETGTPLPEHISARNTDIPALMDGLLCTNRLLLEDKTDAVLSATIVAFGFVFIHPFVDGNGRIHRYLIHHVLAKKAFSKQGVIFPVSAAILNHIGDYKEVLEAYSRPLLDFIEWEETEDHNVRVLNDTMDYYRYFDCTRQAEFLFDCVKETVEIILPEEVNYLKNYDDFKYYLDNRFDFPDKLVAMMVRCLEQNDGRLSKKAKAKWFDALMEDEVQDIESKFAEVFLEL